MKTTALNEFKNLKENEIYSLAKVEWWLMKYESYYKDLKPDWYCNICDLDRDFFSCSCENPSREYVFLVLFRELEEFCDFRRYENYFKGELETYYRVKDNPKALKEFVIKNEQIGANECFSFSIDYLDYPNSVHPKVYSRSFTDFDIYVDRKDFENTITFIEIFNKLFWDDKIYPESEILLRIEKEMKRLLSKPNIPL